MDYIDITNENHSTCIENIIKNINNEKPISTMNNFIEKIIKKNNRSEYKLLCNALYNFLFNSSGGALITSNLPDELVNISQLIEGANTTAAEKDVNKKALLEKINKIEPPIKIPYKNKLLIDEQFELKDENIKYKYYLSFYIIYAINNTTDSSSGD